MHALAATIQPRCPPDNGMLMKKSNAIILIVFVTFATISSGCFLYSASYKNLDPRCKGWVKQYYAEYDRSKEFILSIPDAETRYSYYICINRITATFAIGDDVFNDIPTPTIKMLKEKLPTCKGSWEYWKSFGIIYELHFSGSYNVSKDEEMISIMKNSVSRITSEIFKEDAERMIRYITSSGTQKTVNK